MRWVIFIGKLTCYGILCSPLRYYSEELTAPILTIFVGGNHEASNYMQELPYGGWVAPNIWYMGKIFMDKSFFSCMLYCGLRLRLRG